ncbi:hypothetical protein JB92DRAFT_3130409 [Gautieria morchelliformis]|nr:hypothetical protein JB92DRAFT_3130409 [Gautieria morchelliformis]
MSPVSLPNLPTGWYFIEPSSWSFTVTDMVLDNQERAKCRVKRLQLPLQPAFAITGHSAQGKTLPKVLVNLKEGGFAAYVAASRATSRTGLFITEPVCLVDLNKPVHSDLLFEARRFKTMAANTRITYGFNKGTVAPVPDAEALNRVDIRCNINFAPDNSHALRASGKRRTAPTQDIGRTVYLNSDLAQQPHDRHTSPLQGFIRDFLQQHCYT